MTTEEWKVDFERRLEKIEAELGALRLRANQVDINEAVSDVQRGAIENQLDDIRNILDKIINSVTWAIRMIVGAVILAIVAFALDGGFSVEAFELLRKQQ